MEGIANWILGHIEVLAFVIPILLVLWESMWLSHRGSYKHWRRLGLSLSVAGFSMTLGLLLKSFGLNNTIVLVAIVTVVLAYAIILPAVVWTIAETKDGVVRIRSGPFIATLTGVFLYTFSVKVAIEIETLVTAINP